MAFKRCREAFAYWVDGVPRVIHEGDVVDETDDAYRDHKTLFEAVRASNVAAVERATAAPGERRRLKPKD